MPKKKRNQYGKTWKSSKSGGSATVKEATINSNYNNSYSTFGTTGYTGTGAYSTGNADWWKKGYYNCHTGNVAIFAIGEGTLWAGGWMRGGKPEDHMILIDLADRFSIVAATVGGFERSMYQANQNTRKVVSLFIKDFGVPTQTRDFWVAFAQDVKDTLMAGQDIMVMCDGGHGRTGMVLAILAHLLGQTEGFENPIHWVRSVYCEEAVETIAQENYVYDICNLALPISTKYQNTGRAQCIICNQILDPKWGDDMDAEICSDCISKYRLTDADLEKTAAEKDKVTDELVSKVVEEDSFQHKLCVVCSQELETGMGDDLKHGICYDCLKMPTIRKQYGIPEVSYHPLDGEDADDPVVTGAVLGHCINCGENMYTEEECLNDLCFSCMNAFVHHLGVD